jgi:hypothetical protein
VPFQWAQFFSDALIELRYASISNLLLIVPDLRSGYGCAALGAAVLRPLTSSERPIHSPYPLLNPGPI